MRPELPDREGTINKVTEFLEAAELPLERDA
jgi:hypothetical protein